MSNSDEPISNQGTRMLTNSRDDCIATVRSKIFGFLSNLINLIQSSAYEIFSHETALMSDVHIM
jgi:t-SNARE complex subunit (syntaxin)